MGFKVKGFKKFFRNPSHSKLFKSLPFSHYESKLRKKFGLTGKRAKKIGRQLKEMMVPSVVGGSGTSMNSAGAVIPSTLGKSVTEMY